MKIPKSPLIKHQPNSYPTSSTHLTNNQPSSSTSIYREIRPAGEENLHPTSIKGEVSIPAVEGCQALTGKRDRQLQSLFELD